MPKNVKSRLNLILIVMYKDLNISDSIINEIENAAIEQHKEDVERTKQRIVKSFAEKGYEPADLKISPCIKFINKEKFCLFIFVEAQGFHQDFQVLTENGNSICLYAYSTSINFTKRLNQAILAASKVKNSAIEDFVSKKSSEILKAKKKSDFDEIKDVGFFYGRLVATFPYNSEEVALSDEAKSHYLELLRIDSEEKAKVKREQEEKMKAAKEELKNWAKSNGSELLKLRIKHNQNWLSLAKTEFAKKLAPGFSSFSDLYNEDVPNYWFVKNATFDQLKELEEVSEKFKNVDDVDIDIIRAKLDDETHHTFLLATVNVPTDEQVELFKEISDVSDEE